MLMNMPKVVASSYKPGNKDGPWWLCLDEVE